MTTPKRNTTSHKHPASKSEPSGARAFDIIPRSQVRPSVTARPVLTPTRPEQSDNTLQSSSQAASSQLKHGTLSFTPSAPELDDGDAKALLDQVATITADVDREVNKPKAAAEPESASESEPDEDKAGNKTKDLAEDKLDDKPDDQGKDQEELKDSAEVPADTDTLHLDQDESDPTSVLDETKGADENSADTPPEPAAEADAEPAEAAEAAPEPDGLGKTPGGKEPTDGSIDHIFKDDSQTIEHSQALKDELQTMSDKPEEEVHPHHELYGGKPVIVIHKAHSARSALNWLLWFIFCVLLALVIVDVFLDAGVITTDYNVPHTHYLQ